MSWSSELAALQRADRSEQADGLDAYGQVLDQLHHLAETDVAAARERIRALTGEIRLVEHKRQIVAMMTGDLLGLLSLTAYSSDLILFRDGAGGARGTFGHFYDGRPSRVSTHRTEPDPADPDDDGGPSGGPPHGGDVGTGQIAPAI